MNIRVIPIATPIIIPIISPISKFIFDSLLEIISDSWFESVKFWSIDSERISEFFESQ